MIEYFPPSGCRICETYAAVHGMELSKALRLMRRVFAAECLCRITLAAHGIEHPHAAAIVGCRAACEGQAISKKGQKDRVVP